MKQLGLLDTNQSIDQDLIHYDQRKVLLRISIDMNENSENNSFMLQSESNNEVIVIKEGDDPMIVSQEFCQKNGLS